MRVLTIIPTYNELESLPKTLQRLRQAVPASDVLVVDDNSPDGTGQLADSFAAADAQEAALFIAGNFIVAAHAFGDDAGGASQLVAFAPPIKRQGGAVMAEQFGI